MHYSSQSIKCGVHQRLIAIYIYFKFHEIRFRAYLVTAKRMDFKSIQGLLLINY